MGKGYNNYMTKKPFHPGSKANIKRTWMAEQRTENEKRKQEDLKTQYDKEQDLYNNRALLSTESKDKLQLNFMYEAPPGAKRERQKEDDEPEYKFEWQRKYNAPREDYAKGNEEIRDQPFGIPVRNVRCIKCHKWGHINTDRECPLYSQTSSSSMPTTSMDPLELMRQMREDGYDLKKSALGHQMNPRQANQQFIPSDESDPEMDFLKSLSSKQKRKLLKKLNRLSKKQKKDEPKKKKDKKRDKSKFKKDPGESDTDTDVGPTKKHHKKVKTEQKASESDSASSDENETPVHKEKKRKVVKKGQQQIKTLPKQKKTKHTPNPKSRLESVEELPNKVKLECPLNMCPDKTRKPSCETKVAKVKIEKNISTPTDSETQKKADKGSKKARSEGESTSSKANADMAQASRRITEHQTTKTKLSTSSSESSDAKSTGKSKKSAIKHSEADSSEDYSDSEKITSKKGTTKRTKSDSSDDDSDGKKFIKPKKKLPMSASTSTVISSDASEADKHAKHPDGFDPDFPQRTFSDQIVKLNKSDEILYGRFRNLHRHRRSPSIKHKYRSD